MYFPKMAEENSVQQVVDQFGGIDRNLRIANNAFYDMHNMSSRDYPVLSTRRRRGLGEVYLNPKGLITKDSIAIVDGENVIYNDHVINMGLTDGVKQLVSMGAYLVIFPDKKYINTVNIEDRGLLEHKSPVTSVSITMCNADGKDYDIRNFSNTAPTEYEDGTLWVDTSGETPSLKQYSASSSMWIAISTVYVKLKGGIIGEGFKQFDGVTISGIKNSALASLNGSHILQKVDSGSVVIVGILNNNLYTEKSVVIERVVPDMDFVIECGNRLWGCKYGTVDNKTINEIYASKLGDFKNWNCFQGVATDSFAASRGSDGAFTGAITHLGHPLFFKEDCLEKVYPSASGAHQIVTTELRGVQSGSWRSMEIVDEVLYYKSRDGIVAYTGSLPTEVSNALGDVYYSDARAGSVDSLYYISMKRRSGDWELLVFDTKKGAWYKEDNTKAQMFTTCDGELYWIDEANGQLVCRVHEIGEEEPAFDWLVESGVLGLDIPENQYMTRFLVRADLDNGSEFNLYIAYEDGEWQKKISYNRSGLHSFNVPVIPNRCDHLRVKMEGHGNCSIYSISKHITGGSEYMW